MKLDAEQVSSLKQWMDEPDHTVSPLVVNRAGGRYLIIDGNHRANAAVELGRTHIDAYIVAVDQEKFEGMALAANARNAKGLTYADRVELGQSLALKYGTAVAAAQVLLKHDVLVREMRVQDGRRKIHDAINVDAGNWPKKKLEALNRLDLDQIKAVGSDVLKEATGTEVEQTVSNILAVPASDRHDQAVKESGRLEQVLRDKKKPGARRRNNGTLTSNRVRTDLIRFTKWMKDNPAVFNDTALMEAVTEFVHAVSREDAAAA
jgi:ParB-like chromosome segregation protein Spo0J